MNKQSMCSTNRARSRYCIHQDRTFPELNRGDPSAVAVAMVEKQRDRSLKRAIMIETWMEKQSSSSSESSSGGGSSTLFSSSETEPCYRDKFCSSGFKASRPKPLRSDNHKSPDGFAKTKLRASETYGESKKPKQPISPGRRISIFLNSIFSSGNGRKAKMCSIGAVEDVNLDCRSKTQPFSRSCMTKTDRKFKTVRFCPVDEFSRSCGSEDDPGLMPAKQTVRKLSSKNVTSEEVEMEKQSINGGSAGEFLKMKGASESDEEYQDDDMNSCASSDLFELDHLIGKDDRFWEELPVYETTSFKTNIFYN